MKGMMQTSDKSTGACPVADCASAAFAWTCPGLTDGYVDACAQHAEGCLQHELHERNNPTARLVDLTSALFVFAGFEADGCTRTRRQDSEQNCKGDSDDLDYCSLCNREIMDVALRRCWSGSACKTAESLLESVASFVACLSDDIKPPDDMASIGAALCTTLTGLLSNLGVTMDVDVEPTCAYLHALVKAWDTKGKE